MYLKDLDQSYNFWDCFGREKKSILELEKYGRDEVWYFHYHISQDKFYFPSHPCGLSKVIQMRSLSAVLSNLERDSSI